MTFLAGNNYPDLPHSQGGRKFATQISPLLYFDQLLGAAQPDNWLKYFFPQTRMATLLDS